MRFINKLFTYQIWKQLDSDQIWKQLWFGKQTYAFRLIPHSLENWRGLTSFVSRDKKWIMTIELQYYVKLRANFKLDKSENLSIWFGKGNIMDIQSFVDVNFMGRKWPSNHFQSGKCFIYVKIWFLCQA